MPYNNLVQSVLRGMDIILEIGKSEKGMTLRELAQNLNLKTPTLHNLLRTLKARGFIRQCPGQARYVLGQTLFDLTALNRESRLMTEAENAVRSLFDEMRQNATITFSQQIGGELMTVLRMSPDQPVMLQKPRQQTLNPYASATALVLHAFGNDEDCEAVQERHPFQECAGLLANDILQFNVLVKQVRKQGYASTPILYPDQIAVAAPILSGTKELLGIIGVSKKKLAPEEASISTKQEASNRVLNAARKLSEFWTSLTENRSATTENNPI